LFGNQRSNCEFTTVGNLIRPQVRGAAKEILVAVAEDRLIRVRGPAAGIIAADVPARFAG